ncbi:MAG: hypothetical protein KA821_06965 [Chitinophagaceae bacterium]|nr:hypothetical protein [Chitinophagaceae bacterium]
MEKYFSMSIQSVGIQVLETVYIITTTKNFDTLKSRYELLLERISTLRDAEDDRLYSGNVNASIETYKSMYYDRPLQGIQLSAISKPNNFDVQSFYCEALLSCIKRFVEEQKNEISELKSENAKIKRRTKVIDKIKLSKSELQSKCTSTSSYLTALNSLETIQATLT